MTVSRKNGATKKTAHAKQTLASLDSDNVAVGLLANGSSRSWEVSVDESLAGSDRWFVQIEGPFVYLYFEIPSLAVIGKTLKFLSARPAVRSQAKDTLEIGMKGSAPVTLMRDDEHSDRFFLVMGCETTSMVRLSITAADLPGISEALEQVEADLSGQ